MTFSPLQFPLDRSADELCPPLPVLKDGINAGQRSLGEPGRGLFLVDLRSAHGGNIDDITYYYKGQNR